MSRASYRFAISADKRLMDGAGIERDEGRCPRCGLIRALGGRARSTGEWCVVMRDNPRSGIP